MPVLRSPGKVFAQIAVLVTLLILSSLAVVAMAPSASGRLSAVPTPALARSALAPSALPVAPRVAVGANGATVTSGQAAPSAARAAAPPTGSGAVALRAASADLAAGTGPSRLAPLHCALTNGGSSSCLTTSGGISPAIYSKPFGFQPTSPSLGAAPPAVVGGDLAWDPLQGIVLFFGGQDPTSGVLLNQTWEYEGGEWVNLTTTVAPPARDFGAMAYDSYLAAMILVGGCGVTVCPLYDTWENYFGTWSNITANAFPLTYGGPGIYAPSLTENGTNGLVLFGGCWDASCSDLNSNTWFFSTYPGLCPDLNDPCWWSFLSLLGPAGRYYTSFVADGATGYDLLYGGLTSVPGGGTGGTDGFNDTWQYAPSTYTWTDLTPTLYLAAYPGDAIFGMTLFYDPATLDVFMYGGENATYATLENAFWGFNGGSWVSAFGIVVPPPWPMTFAAIASAPPGYVYPPVLFGGVNSTLVTGSNETWVFEPGLITNASAIPTTVETNATVNFFANVTGGSCDDDFYFGECFPTWNFGNNGVADQGNVTTTYTQAGTYNATLEGYDIYGVSNYSTVTITVTTFTVSASALPTTVAQGTAVTFSATPDGGTPAYNFTWQLSDGSVAWGASIVHAFLAAGTAWANVTVTDATGTEVNQSVSILVVSPLGGSISAAPSAGVDLGHSVRFTAAGSGGLSPYNYSWSVGSSTGYGATFVYTPSTAGPITADVTIKDSLTSTVTKSLTLTVSPALSAAPSATPNSTATGTSVTFASGASGGTGPFTYGWEFGDGHSSAAAAPAHSYSAAGTYTVQLWVNDSGGGAVLSSVSVTVKSTSTSSGLGSTLGGLALWEWLALIVAIVVVVAVVVLAVRRKGRRSAPPPSPPPSPPSPPTMQSPPPPPPSLGPPPGAM